MPSLPEIALIIPNFNGMRWLPDCLASLARQTVSPSETVIVDNGSSDGSVEYIRKTAPGVRILALGRNTGFAGAVKAGIAATRSPFVALLNTDTRADMAWLAELAGALNQAEPDVGGVAGLMQLMEDPSRVENAGDELSWQGAAEKRGHGEPIEAFLQPCELFSCCAGAVLYRREFLEATGGFDESFFAYLEDIDLGLRGRQLGYRYLYVPSARVLHHGHGSGLPGPRYVRWTTRNRLAVLAKNIPGRLLLRHLPSLLYGQWFFLVCHRRPWSSLCGLWDFLRIWPRIQHQRRELLARAVLKADHLDALLRPRMRAPGLLRAAWKRIRGASS
jgi:GT2 family glycosyltransferase